MGQALPHLKMQPALCCWLMSLRQLMSVSQLKWTLQGNNQFCESSTATIFAKNCMIVFQESIKRCLEAIPVVVHVE